jgi:hypothetical protein
LAPTAGGGDVPTEIGSVIDFYGHLHLGAGPPGQSVVRLPGRGAAGGAVGARPGSSASPCTGACASRRRRRARPPATTPLRVLQSYVRYVELMQSGVLGGARFTAPK